jgi:hypothetical protein
MEENKYRLLIVAGCALVLAGVALLPVWLRVLGFIF